MVFRRSRQGLALLVVIVLVVCAFAVGLLFAFPSTVPASLGRDPGAVTTFSPNQIDLVDSRESQVTVTMGAGAKITFPRSGTVTSLNCAKGRTMESWQSHVALDGRALLNVATATPLWRDLQEGDSGPDVFALQSELKRLGFSIRVDGVLGQATIRIIRTRLKEIGVAITPGITGIERQNLLWLPTPTVQVSRCLEVLGSTVQQGAAFVELTLPIVSVQAQLPSDLLPGARLLVVGDARFPIDEQGHIVSDAELTKFASTPGYLSTLAQGGESSQGMMGEQNKTEQDKKSGSLKGKLELDTAIKAWVVPPSALGAISGRDACVSAEGKPVSVKIVGSELGKSYVVFSDTSTQPVLLDVKPPKSLKCR